MCICQVLEEKYVFILEAFNTVLDIYFQKVVAHFSDVDWSFLYHLGEEEVEEGTKNVAEEASVSKVTGGNSEAIPPSKIVPTSILVEAAPVSLL